MPPHPRQLPPFLAPGARVIRRGRDSWQIGIDPRRRVVVSSSPERDAELDALRRGATTPGQPSPLSTAMARAGLLSVPPQGPLHVVVRGSLDGTAVPFVDTAGIVVDTTSARQTPGLLLSAGEPAREELDPWLRDSRTHIVVRVVDGRVIVGPLVVPGETACLRCIDCHLIDAEPEHYAVLHRYVHAPREDGHSDAAAPLESRLALAWALRDLESHLAGRGAVTLSSTLTFGEAGVERLTWRRHPECACAWSGTIGV